VVCRGRPPPLDGAALCRRRLRLRRRRRVFRAPRAPCRRQRHLLPPHASNSGGGGAALDVGIRGAGTPKALATARGGVPWGTPTCAYMWKGPGLSLEASLPVTFSYRGGEEFVGKQHGKQPPTSILINPLRRLCVLPCMRGWRPPARRVPLARTAPHATRTRLESQA
jgi:hypothetical protein